MAVPFTHGLTVRLADSQPVSRVRKRRLGLAQAGPVFNLLVQVQPASN